MVLQVGACNSLHASVPSTCASLQRCVVAALYYIGVPNTNVIVMIMMVTCAQQVLYVQQPLKPIYNMCIHVTPVRAIAWYLPYERHFNVRNNTENTKLCTLLPPKAYIPIYTNICFCLICMRVFCVHIRCGRRTIGMVP